MCDPRAQLDRRVLESCGDLGVPKVEKKPLTNPRLIYCLESTHAFILPEASHVAGSRTSESATVRRCTAREILAWRACASRSHPSSSKPGLSQNPSVGPGRRRPRCSTRSLLRRSAAPLPRGRFRRLGRSLFHPRPVFSQCCVAFA